ncbi:MAG: cytochrome c3 family protein [Acidobacteria bacterium]|nr:cytochrome c3 family protein [Acidobacteriota bacterium]
MKPFLLGLVGAFFVGLLALNPVLQKGVQQPIQFNHQAHKDIDCTGCHESANAQAFAGLPTIDLCMTCHETALTKNPEEEKIRILAREGKPAQWQRLFKQPSHVFYSHRRHVEIAKLECKQCHGDMGERTAPPSRVHNLTMNECIDCHQEKKVQAGCVDCHR